MKKLFFLAVCSLITCCIGYALQKTIRLKDGSTTPQQNITFTKSDQQKIQKILGNDFTAVLGAQGQLVVVTPNKVSDIKATSKGGFSGLPGNSASVTFASYEKVMVYKRDTKSILNSKLGQERFEQLRALMSAKGLSME